MHDKRSVKMEEALQLWVEDMKRKHILNDDKVLCQKALSYVKPEARDP